jgi:hypothetical protein
MRPDLERFFRNYAKLYNQALSEKPDYQGIMDCFSASFIAAGPAGVKCGDNGPEFRAALERGYDFYRRIGARKMSVKRCQITEIDAAHNMVKVFYRADYVKTSGEPVSIDFDVTYLLENGDGAPRIFAFITADEMDAYRRAGLVA